MVTPSKVKVAPLVTLKSLAASLPEIVSASSAPLMVISLLISIPFTSAESNASMYA